ncbi:MAG: M24 family metallopeptidase [Endomicrobiia bacterium]|nr:M24 family metallopeptidase [Endomicrobiia bacterium]
MLYLNIVRQSPMFHLRIKKLSSALDDNSAYLAALSQDVFYLTGAPFDGFFALVNRCGNIILAAGRMTARQVGDYFGDKKVVSGDSPAETVLAAARKLGVRRLFLSPSAPTGLLREIKKAPASLNLRLLESDDLVRLREIKEKEEIAIIGENQRITRRAVAALGRMVLKKGVSEREVRRRIIEYFLRMDGDPAFDPIVAFGKNSAVPHHVAGPSRLKDSDVAMIDAGFRRKGYASDLTRTYLLGRISPLKKTVFETVKAARKSAISSIRAGVACAAVDAAARRIITKRGFGGDFIHGTGHGLGIEVHESPSLVEKSRGTLLNRMVVTVEPGVYIRGEFGVRIEDVVVVEKKGCEVL